MQMQYRDFDTGFKSETFKKMNVLEIKRKEKNANAIPRL